MTITSQDLRAIAPDIVAEDALLDLSIEEAMLHVSEAKFGRKYKFGVLLMAAHIATLGVRAGNGGPVTSERVGELARSYGQIGMKSDADSLLASTSYGQRYLSLRKTIPFTPLVT